MDPRQGLQIGAAGLGKNGAHIHVAGLFDDVDIGAGPGRQDPGGRQIRDHRCGLGADGFFPPASRTRSPAITLVVPATATL